MIDHKTGQMISPMTEMPITVSEVLESNLIVDAEKPLLGLEDAAAKGLITDDGKIIDVRTAEQKTLQEAVSSGLLDSDKSAYH